MRYFIGSKMVTFGTSGDVKINSSTFAYFPKERLIKSDDYVQHNFKPKATKLFRVKIGDVIEAEDFKLTIKQGTSIELEGNYQTNLINIDSFATNYPDYPEYTSSPRIKKQVANTKVDLERIPEKDKDTSIGSLAKKLIPAIVGIVMAIIMLWVRPRGVRGLLMLVTTLISFAISMITLYTERRDGNAHNKLRKETYENYLYEKRHELAQLKIAERESANYNYLDLKQILVELDCKSSRLFERDITEDDFLRLRIGTQTSEPTYSITNPFEKLELRYEEADEELKVLYEEYREITEMPLTVNAKYNIGLVGNRYVISKQMKNILMQSIFNHSPLDLQILVITDDIHLDDYMYAFSMGHFQDREKVHRYFVHNRLTRDKFLNRFTQILRQRDMEYKPGVSYDQHLLLIIDNPALISNHPIREFLEKSEERLGMSQIQVAIASNELPKHIRTTIDFKTEQLATLILEQGQLVNKDFTLPKVDIPKRELELYYRRLSNLEHVKGIKSSVPEKLGFLEMYDVKNPQQLQISHRWQKNKTYKSLAALLGRKSETDNIYLDLHEKVHGPHGLIAGTTGSGKSEVIQSYILSLAIEFSPEQVGFLLIDYKGGGMANLFKDLPHHLGSITNLDGYQSMRALASIKSELKRRQQIFSDNNVNHINNYTKLYEAGDVPEPLPHLFLISDEFAELKAEQPEFMKELVSAARIGRSLGVHLILATQKPDGVVDDQIWSNSKFKLCLKVAEEADSKALLKTADAAYITNPGRGYLKVGTNELYELFQSGYSGADFIESNEIKINPEIYLIDMYGNQTLKNPEECVVEEEIDGIANTELDIILEEIDNIYQQANLTPVRKPWLPPLENYINEKTKIKYNIDSPNYTVKLGTIDIPTMQIQTNYYVNFETDGNLLIVGESGMGKSFTIINAVFKLALQNYTSQMKLFVFDLSNGGLIHLKDLKHTSEYFNNEFNDKQKQFCSYIITEMDTRKQLFVDNRVSSFKTYNNISKIKIQAIFVVIDTYDNLEVLDEDVSDVLKKLIVDGPNLGIFIIASATTSNKLKQNVLINFKNILLLHTAMNEINMLLKKSDYQMQEIPGRGFILVDEVEVVQVDAPIPDCDASQVNNEFEKVVVEINKYQISENKSFEMMPEVIPYKKYNLDNEKIYIGQAFANLKSAVISLETMQISGLNKAGKSNFLKLIIEQIKTKKKITILDDTSYSLLEYSETHNINYITNPEDIDINSNVVIINKLSRFDKLKPKVLNPILEKMFLMHLKGTKFIVETDSKGLKVGKVDIWTAVSTAKYYIHFGNPINQERITVDKKKYKKEHYKVSEAYLITETNINKIKIPKVITGNENRQFVIPELKALEQNAIPQIIEALVVGDNNSVYINSVVRKNEQVQFYILGNKLEIKQQNAENIAIENLGTIQANQVLVINGLEELNSLRVNSKREVLTILETVKCKMIILVRSEIKLSGERLRGFRKKYVITSDPSKAEIQTICRTIPRKAQNQVLKKNEAIKVIGNEVEKIKY